MNPRVVIIGAGFGGIAAAAALLDAGVDDVVLLEKAGRVGGGWRDNAYPGCACDVPAPLFSYSFAPTPGWSRRFPPHREILDYLQRTADERGITPLVRFHTDVTRAVWDATAGKWRVRTADGGEVVAD